MAASTLLQRPPEVTVLDHVEGQQPVRTSRDQGFFGRALTGTPWKTGDVVRLASRLALGLAGLVVSWVGCSGSLSFRTQSGWTAGAVLALVVAASGGAAWVLSGLGEVGRERRLVREQIRSLYLTKAEPQRGIEIVAGFVTATGMKRYHRADCDVVRGKATRAVRDDRADAALEPCRMCLP
jgi:hypothetical protein